MGDSFTLMEGSFASGRGIKLYTRKYIPASSYSVVFLFLHGVGEHCTRFHDTFSTITKQGIAVYALDHQGHGKSEGARFDCRSFEEFTDDIFTYNDIIRRENKPSSQVCRSGLFIRRIAGVLHAPALGLDKSWLMQFQGLFAPILEFLVPTWEVVRAINLESETRLISKIY
ncbi:hypothetical protein Ae201684P_009541 [Aphanomyces euteiches]|nr:hypothetical protein Ae201684P_009541 [Aphanomyces euteiches]